MKNPNWFVKKFYLFAFFCAVCLSITFIFIATAENTDSMFSNGFFIFFLVLSLISEGFLVISTLEKMKFRYIKKAENQIESYYKLIKTDSNDLVMRQNNIAKRIIDLEKQIKDKSDIDEQTSALHEEIECLNKKLSEMKCKYENIAKIREPENSRIRESLISFGDSIEHTDDGIKYVVNELAPAETLDALKYMAVNMKEINDYFQINKRQATLSFYITLFSFIIGIALIIGTAAKVLLFDIEFAAAIIPAIGGTITEIIAGISLVMYKKTLTQLNLYYESLHSNERFLSTINLVDKLSKDRQDDMYVEIIRNSFKSDSPK